MSFSNSNTNFTECDKYFNHESNDFKLFSKQNSLSNYFNFRSSSNFSLFGKGHKVTETGSRKLDKIIEEPTDNGIEVLPNFKQETGIEIKEENGEENKKNLNETRNNRLRKKKSNFYKRKSHKKKDIFKSLANRNLKLNMGTGLIQFIDFKRSLAKFKRNSNKFKKYNDILQHLVEQNFNFRSFLGWKSMWNDKKHGRTFKKLSHTFFGETFVYSYIFFSKIKLEYKNLYYSKIESFRRGSINPESFGPYSYNHSIGE